jgi:hypothetical protein
MKKLFIFLIIAIAFQSGYSQATSKEDKVRSLLVLTGANKLGVQIGRQMLSNFQSSYKDVPSDFWEKFKSEIDSADLVTPIIPVYLKYYTENDLDQLIAFYKTPVGQKIISVTPQLMLESMKVGQDWGRQVAEKVFKEMSEKGYKID